ncbi:ribonuclease H-like YkuK family protein [Alicyclobacillus sp.]|uniref:ribonuclease H-like YkuK family protein n=1 Tax=Alicyclobacillus sp. TaxID=61169 RepID=UPI0025B7C112|nr:ribonuclease H-like YkuK family protein [Alicyclobacillus sp.]MCL6516624.1 ribonuclease H-like YkuK family protein [Alicyclobacillus sp.]
MWMFDSPSRGTLTLEQVTEDVRTLMAEHPHDEIRVMVGTDSQPRPGRRQVTFVTAVIVHHVGRGARYYIHREQQEHVYSLRQRMFTEASYSLQVGGLLSEQLNTAGGECRLEVHLDVGERGPTKQWVREIVAWITQNGYDARIKPDAFGASKVADRYTKH